MKLHRKQLLLLLLAGMLAVLIAVRVWAGTTGTVSGTVKDAQNGAPLSGANVVIGGTKLSTVTDASGRFVITNVAPGDYEVTAEMVGYATQKTDAVLVTMDTVAKVKFDLTQQAIVEAAVVVTRPRPMIETRVPATLNLITAQQEPLTRLDPASLRTAPGLLSSLPGVLVEADGSGQMHLRGGKADQIGWYVEGIPLTDPNTATFGTNLFTTGINKFQMYTGGFGVEYGNAISGVLNEVKKTGAVAPGFNTDVENGTDGYQSAFGEYGGGTSDTFNYYVGSSLLKSDLSGPVIKELKYSDNTVKLVWPQRKDTITLLGMQGSQVGLLSLDHTIGVYGDTIDSERDYMRQRFAVLGLAWNRTFSPRSFMVLQPYYQFSSSVGSAMGGSIDGSQQGWDARSARTGLQARYVNELNDVHSLKLGGSMLRSDNNYYYNVLGFMSFNSGAPTVQSDYFLEDQMTLSDRFTVTPGIRYESMTYKRQGLAYVAGAGYSGEPVGDATESGYVPRLGLAYSTNDHSSWKANWGKYTKFVSANAAQMVYTDPDAAPYGPGSPTLEQMMPGLGATAPQRNTELEFSYEGQVSNSFAWRLTHFRNDFDNLSDYSSTAGTYQFTNLGRGKSSGMEFYARKRMSDNWQGWLSYTYQISKSNRADLGLANDLYYTPWDQRSTVALVTECRTGNWVHGLRLDTGSGRQGRSSSMANVLRAQPYATVSYNLRLNLPKALQFGDSLYLNVYNLFNSGQTMQYRWNSGAAQQDRYGWVPPKFISFGVSRAM